MFLAVLCGTVNISTRQRLCNILFLVFDFYFIFLLIIVLLSYFFFVYAQLRIGVDIIWSKNWNRHALGKVVEEENIAQRILLEDNPLISSDTEDEITMAVVPPQTIGDYCKRTDEWEVSRGFLPEDPDNFDIKNFVLSGLKDNSFNGNTIRDPWEHLGHFYKTTSMYKPSEVTEDQFKVRLFGFSLIWREKDWLLCLPNGIIQTWKELEDKLLERFFTTTQFAERRVEIVKFKQQKTESLYDSWERFKLLLCRCPNHICIISSKCRILSKVSKVKHVCC